MEKVQWTDALSVRVSEIDEQHKSLIRMINELLESKENEKGEEFVSGLISKLVDYIDYHFGTEEKYMTRFKYPDLSSHRSEHREFIKQVMKFRRDYAEKKATLTEDVLCFLADWFKNHIQGTDMGYSDCFVKNGLS